jgi:succinate dehydrogenase flavin-adding protein (antitoxin of CptAB toxin-antitoxin module)
MNDFDKKEFSLFFLNCRRGMLELDVMLLNFLDIRYYELDLQFKKDFYDFLLESDDNLYSWLVKKKYTNTLKFHNVIEKIIITTNMFDFY